MVCTNMQKVIESIQSRMHIIQLKPQSDASICKFMDYILKQENMYLSERKVKEFLLSVSNHSIRTMINHLEKLKILGGPINMELCQRVCSDISFRHFEEYIRSVQARELQKAIQVLYALYDQGYSVIDILDYFFYFLKSTDLVSEDTKYEYIPYICKYITIFHNIHEDKLELAFFTNSLIQNITKKI